MSHAVSRGVAPAIPLCGVNRIITIFLGRFQMTFLRKVLQLGVVGIATGVALGLATPPRALTADEGCKCTDYGAGSYQCNLDQTECVKGTERCQTDCKEQ